MKKLTFIAGLLMVLSLINAQEINQSVTNIERFLKSNDKIIASQTLHTAKISLLSDLHFTFSKNYELSGTDTVFGVLINTRKDLLSSVEITYSYYKYITGYLDYGEISRILSWMNMVKEKYILSKQQDVSYISFTPAAGKVILFFSVDKIISGKRGLEEGRWIFTIQTDKDDISTRIVVKDYNNLIDVLSDLQKAIEDTMKS